MDGLPGSLARSPELFPHALDPDGERVAFIRLTRSDYEKASFLDARVLTPHTAIRRIPWQEVSSALDSSDIDERLSFIFHIGHVGSTLLSRLIGSHRNAFALREPLLLRSFAEVNPASLGEDKLSAALKMFSRTFEDGQSSVVKATSFVSEIAPTLLSRASSPRAIMMTVAPESYFATILGGPNSRKETQSLAHSRLARLQRRLGEQPWNLAAMSEGEVLALSWVCEMSALNQAARAAAGRALWIDFDRFLASPAGALTAALRHLQFDASAETVATILSGPDMCRYSKAPEHAYDTRLRNEVLDHARAMHGAEIKRGLAWLERAATRFSTVREALQPN